MHHPAGIDQQQPAAVRIQAQVDAAAFAGVFSQIVVKTRLWDTRLSAASRHAELIQKVLDTVIVFQIHS